MIESLAKEPGIPRWMNVIPGSNGWAAAEPVDKGWSADRKYRIRTRDGRLLLLRLSDPGLAGGKREEFERVRQASKLGIPMSFPIDFGICEGAADRTFPESGSPFVYSLLSWIEGEDAQDMLPGLSGAEAYARGRDAGTWLRRMHGLSVPAGAEAPTDTVRREVTRKLQAYENEKHRLPFGAELLERIEARLPLLEGVPAGFRHGDYHPGNMILGPDGGLNVIDFNRSGTGDPLRDFNRMETFTSGISPDFARGQLRGYWESGPRDPDFWGRVSLYCAIECLFAIVWAIPFGEPEITDTLRRSQIIWDDFDGFRRDTPKWLDED